LFGAGGINCLSVEINQRVDNPGFWLDAQLPAGSTTRGAREAYVSFGTAHPQSTPVESGCAAKIAALAALCVGLSGSLSLAYDRARALRGLSASC
jgi:hypothetical protein